MKIELKFGRFFNDNDISKDGKYIAHIGPMGNSFKEKSIKHFYLTDEYNGEKDTYRLKVKVTKEIDGKWVNIKSTEYEKSYCYEGIVNRLGLPSNYKFPKYLFIQKIS